MRADVLDRPGRVLRMVMPVLVAIIGAVVTLFVADATVTVGSSGRRPDTSVNAMMWGVVGAIVAFVLTLIVQRMLRRRTA